VTGRCRDGRGSALVEFTWLAILLMVPLLYIVLAVFAVQRSAFGVSAAAAAAGRAFVLSPTEADARPRAVAAARVALGDQGLDLGRGGITFSCDPDPANCLAPGETVEVRFTLPDRAFAHWDLAHHGWAVVPGEHEVRVGSSSRDIRARATVTRT
jgi:hypothetical protein